MDAETDSQGRLNRDWDLGDRVQHRFCACQLVESKLARQREVARTFGVTERTLERWRKLLRTGGIEALVPGKGGPRKRRKAGGVVGRKIVALYKKGHAKVDIASRLGLSEGTVRSVLKENGFAPGSPPPQPQLPFEALRQNLWVVWLFWRVRSARAGARGIYRFGANPGGGMGS